MCLLAMSILMMLVAAGLNISNQGINDLTQSNPGYVIAVHLEDEGVYIEALGRKYPCNTALLQNGQARLKIGAARLEAYIQEIWQHRHQLW